MSKTLVLDTNIVSYLLKGSHNIEERLRIELINGNNVIMNPITYYEIKRGLLSIGANKKLELFEKFCNLFGIGEITTDIFDKAANIYSELRKKGKTIEDADLFIMAFCICNQYVLITNNTKHFIYNEELFLENWVSQ